MSYHWVTDFDREFGSSGNLDWVAAIPMGGRGWNYPTQNVTRADPVPWLIPIPERVILPPPAPPPPPEDEQDEVEMAHDWGHIFRTVATSIFTPDPFNILGLDAGDTGANGASPSTVVPPANVPVTGGLGTGACDGMQWAGGVPPRGYKVVNSCGVGVLRKVRRRRRRRLLTASDKADISYIVATTGKGQLAASLIHRSAQ